MSAGPRWLLAVLLLAGLVGVAHTPLLGAGFFGADYRILVEATGGATTGGRALPLGELGARDLYALGGDGGSVLTGLWNAGSRRTWGVERGGALGAGHAVAYRIENFAVLVAGAIGLGLFLRRLLLPWSGSEHGAAAACAAAALFCVHPLCTAVIASLSYRDELLALALASWAAAAFLRGRQDRQLSWTVVAGLVSIAAGAAGRLAFALPVVLAGAELGSAHRYREPRDRWRTTRTTLLVYAACVAVDPLVRLALTGAPWSAGAEPRLDDASGSGGPVGSLVEKLGVLVLPVNVHGLGVLGMGIAGLMFLVALQPALRAMRSAPRLWGAILSVWIGAVAVASLAGGGVRVHNGDLSNSHVLFAATATVAAGLGATTTAVSGARRTALPALVVLGHALIAYGNSLPYATASQEVAALRQELYEARVAHGARARVLVVDPPEFVDGVRCLEGTLPWIIDPIFRGSPSSATPAPTVGLTRDAFLAFLREEEFALWRREPLVVLVPDEQVESEAGPPANAGRRLVFVLGPVPVVGPLPAIRREWTQGSRADGLGADPLLVGALVVRDATGPLRLAWTADAAAVGEARVEGAGLAAVGEVRFDLEASLPWRLSERVHDAWLDPDVGAAVRVELRRGLPPIRACAGPTVDGDDWVFELEAGAAGDYSLHLLDIEDLAHVELPAVASGGGVVRFPGAARRASALGDESAARLRWSVEEHAADGVVARSRGSFDATAPDR